MNQTELSNIFKITSLNLFLDIELCDNIPDGWDRDNPSTLDIACICVMIIDSNRNEKQ